MKKWNLVIDVAKCENCNNCMLTTKDEHVGNDFPGYAAPAPRHGNFWIKIHRKVRGEGAMVDAAYRPTTCNHCDDAPCIKAAKDGSVYKRQDGIVIIDPVKAKGRKDLVSACPYGSISWNEELGLPQKWIFDAHLIDQGWTRPRCAQSCPTGAMQVAHVEDAEMQEMAAREQLETLRPELKTSPRVYYRNLYRFNKCFIGGTVVAEVNGVVDCIAGAKVTLKRQGRELQQLTSDAFGDFKFDRLEPGSGPYDVEITHAGFATVQIKVDLTDSRYLGTIRLARAAGGAAPAGSRSESATVS